MCRFFSGFFFEHPLLLGFDWYWRVEVRPLRAPCGAADGSPGARRNSGGSSAGASPAAAACSPWPARPAPPAQPDVHFMCDVHQDPFAAMAAANQSIAWVIMARGRGRPGAWLWAAMPAPDAAAACCRCHRRLQRWAVPGQRVNTAAA